MVLLAPSSGTPAYIKVKGSRKKERKRYALVMLVLSFTPQSCSQKRPNYLPYRENDLRDREIIIYPQGQPCCHPAWRPLPAGIPKLAPRLSLSKQGPANVSCCSPGRGLLFGKALVRVGELAIIYLSWQKPQQAQKVHQDDHIRQTAAVTH